MSKGSIWFYTRQNGIFKLSGIYDLKPSDFGREVCKVLEIGKKVAGYTHYEWRYPGIYPARIERIPDGLTTY